jgi:hypothetical protein
MLTDPVNDVSAETPAGGAIGSSPPDSPSSLPAGAEAANVSPPTESVDASPAIAPQPPIDALGELPEKRGRGRPRKNAAPILNSVTPAPPRPVPPPPAAPVPLPVDYEIMARAAANMWFNIPQLVLGEEWAPESSEVIPVKDAFKDYFESEKLPRIPPSWAIALTLVTYAAKRVNKPTIKERIYGAVSWVKSKIKR